VRAVRGAVALAIALAAAGCAGAAPATPRLTATGIVVRVTSTSPSAVSSFVLRTADGQVFSFSTEAVTFDKDSFPPEHLREHQALAEPVMVTYEVHDGQDVAVRLEDAPEPSPSAAPS
jgi:hypothetical protein